MNYGLKKLGANTTARSACNRALLNAGLDLLPEPTGVRYSPRELLSIARETDLGASVDQWRRRVASTGAVGKRREMKAGD